jgi:hypothetical protein
MKIIIIDNSNYAADKCNNGGSYSFTVTYQQIADNKFAVLHSTSAEFPYCPFCGSFYRGICPCGMEGPDVVDRKTVDKEITCAMERLAQGEELEIIVKGIIVED